MADDRLDQIRRLIDEAAREKAIAVLATEIASHYSQDDWERMARAIGIRTAAALIESEEFQTLLAQGDLTACGQLNAAGIVAAVRKLAEGTPQPGHRAQLQHLSSHLQHTFRTPGLCDRSTPE